jgi:hypothetical protein
VVWAKSGNPGRGPLKERGDDLYETPPEAVEALVKVEPLPQNLWEPCCGSGNIVKVLRARGHQVVATDLQSLGCPGSRSGIDFLMELNAPIGTGGIVTNPPFKLADEFVRHALVLVPKVVMLLRWAYLEGVAREDLFVHLARVYLFSRRIPRMHRAGWAGKKASSMLAFAWFVWDRSHEVPGATLRRIDWKEGVDV